MALALGGSKWQAALPRTEAPAAPGSSFSTVDRGVRSAPAPPGARLPGNVAPAGVGRGLGAGRGVPGTPGDAASSPPAPSVYLLGQGHGPAAPPPGVLRAGAVSWRRAEQRGRAASSHSRCSGHRHPRRGAQAAPAAAARARSPGPPRWLPPPLLLPGTGTSRARAGVETPGPVRATRRREEATVTWDRDARRCRLGRARLRRRHTPGCPRSPTPRPLGSTGPVPRAGQPTLLCPARAALGLESQTELSRRKGLTEGGWRGGWVKGRVGG